MANDWLGAVLTGGDALASAASGDIKVRVSSNLNPGLPLTVAPLGGGESSGVGALVMGIVRPKVELLDASGRTLYTVAPGGEPVAWPLLAIGALVLLLIFRTR